MRSTFTSYSKLNYHCLFKPRIMLRFGTNVKRHFCSNLYPGNFLAFFVISCPFSFGLYRPLLVISYSLLFFPGKLVWSFRIKIIRFRTQCIRTHFSQVVSRSTMIFKNFFVQSLVIFYSIMKDRKDKDYQGSNRQGSDH